MKYNVFIESHYIEKLVIDDEHLTEESKLLLEQCKEGRAWGNDYVRLEQLINQNQSNSDVCVDRSGKKQEWVKLVKVE